jgi:phosphate starvation-inducible protein PhoH
MAIQSRLTRKQKRSMRREGEQILDRNFGMKRINPLTLAQDDLFQAYHSGQNIAAIGSAGSGKTYIAMYLALQDILETEEYKKVIIIRSAVQSRDQGFMPGTQKEKEAHYELPYIEIASDLFERGDAYSILKQKNQIEFMSTSFIRGLSWDNVVIIADEVQNMSYEELRTIITRVGQNSKLVLCGDTKQNDLIKNKYDVSGLVKFLDVITNMCSFSTVMFTVKDVVRSGLVREFIETEEQIDEQFITCH